MNSSDFTPSLPSQLDRIEFVVSREDDLDVSVLVSAKRTNVVVDDKTLLAAIMRAVTSWIKDTEDGRTAWDNSSWDFNIGDLSFEDFDDSNSELGKRLLAESVDRLKIEAMPSISEYWVYDSVLCDREEIRSKI